MNTMEHKKYVAISAFTPLALLGLWILVTHNAWVKPVLLPPPIDVLKSFIDMISNGYSGVNLAQHVLASLYRVGTAFLVGSVLGITVGMIRGRIAAIDAFFLVPSEMLRPIPPLGLIPLFILWFGIGEASKILLIGVSVFLIMMVNAQAGTRSVPADAIRAAETCGARRLQIFRYVVFPSALPQIMTGLRIALGTALSILVASELLGGDRGLGFIVLDAANFFRTTYVFAGIMIIGLIGFLSDRLIAGVTRRLVHWEGRR
jgi:NitT/TauT family transport system permease protein/taurine transport system permease protein